MFIFTRAAVGVVSWRDERHGPLPLLLLVLTMVTGLVDAVSPDLTTTVLTLTLTGFAADSTLAGGSNPHPGRRLVATVTMFLGAAIGAFLVFHSGVSAVLALTLALLTLNGIAAYRLSSSSAAWTAEAQIGAK